MKLRLPAIILMSLCRLTGVGCGSDDTASKPSPAAESGDKDSAKPDQSNAGSSAEPAGVPAVECGSKMCESMGGGPIAAFIGPCCVDEATSTCGLSSPLGGGCMVPPESDERCPSIDVMGILQIASCCSETDRCGINAAMFGMPGCIDLKDAARQIPAMGFITFPAPRTCSGVIDEPESEPTEDAGV